MARNKLAGTTVGKSKSAVYYQKNPEAKKIKETYNKAYRALLAKLNRKKGKKGDGKDVSHTKDGGTVLEPQGANRARNRGKK